MLREYLLVHRGVWEKLREKGFEAYFVGGCVRDALLGRDFNDIDIATDAKTDDIKHIFSETRDIGLKFGSVRVNHEGYFYDITTYRKEEGYSDNRHPDTLWHAGTIENDLERRDFTVNAMAFSFDMGLIDIFGGIDDLEKRIIKAVGEPEKRFQEDALRMMRAVRFACELGFDIEPDTRKAIMKNCEGIGNVSKERILNELTRSLKGRFVEKINYLSNTNLGRCIHTDFRLLKYKGIPFQNDYIMRLSYFLVKPEYAARILGFLKADKKTMSSVVNVLEHIQEGPYESPYEIRRLMAGIGIMDAKRVLLLKKSSLRIFNGILEREDCISTADLQIDGNDLIKAGIAEQGRSISHILKQLLNDVLRNPEHNYYNYLIEKARNMEL